MKASLPTNGSVTILNASAQKGSFGSGLRNSTASVGDLQECPIGDASTRSRCGNFVEALDKSKKGLDDTEKDTEIPECAAGNEH